MNRSDVRIIRDNDKLMNELGRIVRDYETKRRRVLKLESNSDEICYELKNRLSKKARTRFFAYSVIHKILPKKIAKIVGDKIYTVFSPKTKYVNDDGLLSFEK